MQQTKLLIELQTCCIGQHYLSFVTYVLCLIIRDKFEKVFKISNVCVLHTLGRVCGTHTFY